MDVGWQIPPIHRQLIRPTGLCSLCLVMDLSSTLYQPPHSRLSSSRRRIPDCRAIRTKLGNTAVQVLDFADYNVCAVGLFAGTQLILVVLSGEECISIFGL